MNSPKHWEDKNKWNFVLLENDIKEQWSRKTRQHKRGGIKELSPTAGE